jgi:SAM-dependent methyltransferase
LDLKEVGRGGRHPWEIARARFFAGVLRRHRLLSSSHSLLDIGAGDGYVARTLADELPPGAHIVCVDAHYRDEELGGDLRRTRTAPAGLFDLILLLDVIEHVADDRALLAEQVSRLPPYGAVLVSVPAWPSLYAGHDLGLGHHRRYRPARLRQVITDAGLDIADGGGLFSSLLPLRALAALRDRVRPDPAATTFGKMAGGEGVGGWSGGPFATRLVTGALAVDGAVGRALRLPGLSAWALCRRRS